MAISLLLPAGWEQKTDHAGRPYYLNHNNKQSTWQRPGAAGQSVPSSGGKCGVKETIPAATGWERKTDALGRTYFIDHDTQTTTWQRPAPVGAPSGDRENKTLKTVGDVMQEAGNRMPHAQANRAQ